MIDPISLRHTLLQRVVDDLVILVRAGTPVDAESMLSRHPDLASDPDTAAELIAAEFVTRRELGQSPDPQAYLTRYQRWHDPLRRRLQALGVIDATSGPLVTADRTALAPETLEGPPPCTPAALPPHERLEVIGGGGMGIVYRAIDCQLGRLVALKALRGGALAASDDRRRFLREARAAARLRHPNIVPVLMMGTQRGEDCFTMPLFTGGTLAHRIGKGRLAPEKAAEVVSLVARAVQHAHDAGVIHRDLKPSNILFDEQGSPHVGDFGLASLHGSEDLTRPEAAMGTPSYMSPEQTRGSKVGPASDVWALGVLLHECLTGRRPFQAATAAAMHKAIREENPPPVRTLVPSIPADLEAIVLRCLAKTPASRMASAGELADELARWRAGEKIRSTPPPPRVPRAAALSLALLALPLLMGAMMLVPSSSAAGQKRDAIQARIKRGDPTMLVGATGLPADHQWKLEQGRTPLKAEGREPLSFKTWSPTQLELLPGVPVKSYRLTAEVALVGGDADAFVGLYVMGTDRAGLRGQEHAWCYLGIYGPPAAPSPRMGLICYAPPTPFSKSFAATRSFSPDETWPGTGLVGPAFAGRWALLAAAHVAAPPAGAWRRLEMDVSPDRVIARIDGKAAREWQIADPARSPALWWASMQALGHQPPGVPPPAFPVSGAAGLFVNNATVKVRNVYLLPPS